MSIDSFLKIEGVEGESRDVKHQKWIDILSWSWGMTQSGYAHVGGGMGAGKVDVQDISLVKYVDKASPTIMLKCAQGKHFPKVELVVRKAGGDEPLEYFKLQMDDVIVTSYSTGGSGGEDRLTESISFNFAKVKSTYAVQTKAGVKESENEFTWNIAENRSE
jgi:type VI secretion system secreted protein Hcp